MLISIYEYREINNNFVIISTPYFQTILFLQYRFRDVSLTYLRIAWMRTFSFILNLIDCWYFLQESIKIEREYFDRKL